MYALGVHWGRPQPTEAPMNTSPASAAQPPPPSEPRSPPGGWQSLALDGIRPSVGMGEGALIALATTVALLFTMALMVQPQRQSENLLFITPGLILMWAGAAVFALTRVSRLWRAWRQRGMPVVWPTLYAIVGAWMGMSVGSQLILRPYGPQLMTVFQEYQRLQDALAPGRAGAPNDQSDTWHGADGQLRPEQRVAWCAHARPRIETFADMVLVSTREGVEVNAIFAQLLMTTAWRQGRTTDGEFLSTANGVYQTVFQRPSPMQNVWAKMSILGSPFSSMPVGREVMLSTLQMTPRRLCRSAAAGEAFCARFSESGNATMDDMAKIRFEVNLNAVAESGGSAMPKI